MAQGSRSHFDLHTQNYYPLYSQRRPFLESSFTYGLENAVTKDVYCRPNPFGGSCLHRPPEDMGERLG